MIQFKFLVTASVLLMLATLQAPQTLATTYIGSIVGVAKSGMPEFFHWWKIGDIWRFEYRYESDSINGMFRPGPEHGNFALIPKEGVYFDETLPELMGHGPPTLTVVDSVVTQFFFYSGVWLIEKDFWSFDSFGGGPVTITNPIPAPVTEQSSQWISLMLAAAAVAWFNAHVAVAPRFSQRRHR